MNVAFRGFPLIFHEHVPGHYSCGLALCQNSFLQFQHVFASCPRKRFSLICIIKKSCDQRARNFKVLIAWALMDSWVGHERRRIVTFKIRETVFVMETIKPVESIRD